PRFRFDAGDGRWRARIHDALARPLHEVSFVAVDLETTGDGPAASGIIEIGAVRVEGGRLGESFVTLVDPGRAIHPFVVRLTGITDAMVAGAPTIEEALPRFLAFARDGVLVAHNAGFDVGHLDAAQRLVAGRPLDLPALCTLKLARRLMPELRRRGLDAVAGALGHSARVLDLIRHTHDFRTTETGSELAAALLEARQIRALKPPYNRQRKHLPRVGFLKLTDRGRYPRLGVTQRLAADRAT